MTVGQIITSGIYGRSKELHLFRPLTEYRVCNNNAKKCKPGSQKLNAVLKRVTNRKFEGAVSMKKIIRITLITLMLFSLFGCAQKEPPVVESYEVTDKEPSVIKTYEVTGTELIQEYLDNDELLTMVQYYEMSDGTWKTDNYTYQYRLEITGRMGGAVKDSTFVFLSNIEDITFEQAWKASGFSSNMDDYFKEEDAKFVAMK